MRKRVLQSSIAIIVVAYSISVVWFVSTTPDLGIRCLLVDEQAHTSAIEVCAAVGPTRLGKPPSGPGRNRVIPATGDLLLSINGKSTRTFIDFTRALHELRSASIPPGGTLAEGADPLDEPTQVPKLVETSAQGHQLRMLQVEFLRPDSTGTETQLTYIDLHSFPLDELAITLVLFLVQLIILCAGGVAAWNQPNSRPTTLFFSMCIASIGAYVGGFHWWSLAGSPWLNLPFIVCAGLLPAVSLHFFLVFPRPKQFFERFPRSVLLLIYGSAGVSVFAICGLYLAAWFINGPSAEPGAVESVRSLLHALRLAIVSAVLLAGVMFTALVSSLVHSYLSTGSPLERVQLKWILAAAAFATLPFGYTIWLAAFDRAGFVVGKGRFPMFCAGLSFVLAYASGIARHRLMLVDDHVTDDWKYFLVNGSLLGIFALIVAAFGFAIRKVTILSVGQQLVAGIVVVFAITLLLWGRDRLQQVIDQRFFREKYRIGKALERMNRAASHIVEPKALASMMVKTCHDVLHVERIALYFCHPQNDRVFQLAAVENANDIPVELEQADLVETLREGRLMQRVPSASRQKMPALQAMMHELGAELLYPIDNDDGIVGIVMLGPKRAAQPFTAEDLTFLNAMAQITTVALNSARAHQDLARVNQELQLKVKRIAEQRRELAALRAEVSSMRPPEPVQQSESDAGEFRRDMIRGSSPAVQRVLETVRKAASVSSTVLVRGESGTGKELLAQVIHNNSPRRDGPLVSVHCAALSSGVLESELFGHVKGAFTGASVDKKGRFEIASGGTLFLDEIGDISLETQIKLLRVLQERSFEAVGGTRTISVDVRVIAATHQNLEELITRGRFREDLFYRLNVISVTLPPLRDRHEDLIELAVHFLQRAVVRVGKDIRRIDDAALAALERYSWPGNIRELQNVIERAVVLADGRRITLTDLPTEISEFSGAVAAHRQVFEMKPIVVEGSPTAASMETLRTLPRSQRREAERQLLLTALQRAEGNKAEAARLLGLARSTFYSKIKRHQLPQS